MKKVPKMQPLEVAKDGVVCFRRNRIVSDLVVGARTRDGQKLDLNAIHTDYKSGKYDAWEALQFWQLVGHSINNYGDVFNASHPKIVAKADRRAERLLLKQSKRGDG